MFRNYRLVSSSQRKCSLMQSAISRARLTTSTLMKRKKMTMMMMMMTTTTMTVTTTTTEGDTEGEGCDWGKWCTLDPLGLSGLLARECSVLSCRIVRDIGLFHPNTGQCKPTYSRRHPANMDELCGVFLLRVDTHVAPTCRSRLKA